MVDLMLVAIEFEYYLQSYENSMSYFLTTNIIRCNKLDKLYTISDNIKNR